MLQTLKFLSLFLWLAGAAALVSLYHTKGLPHVIWNYSFLKNGNRYSLAAPRIYTDYEFVGPYGVFRTGAKGGRCGWVRLFKERS